MHAELQLDNQICFRLYTSARLITQAYTPMLTELGITYPQYLVLMVLWVCDAQLRQHRRIGLRDESCCRIETEADLIA